MIESQGSKLFLVTNLNAPNKRVVTVDATNPTADNWVDLIPETENVLSVSTGGGYLFASYMVDAISKVQQYDMAGKLVRDISLPGVGTAGGFGGESEDTELYYSFTNYKTPGTTFKFNVETGKSEIYRESAVDFDPAKYESKQVFYKSKDGTQVPMIVTYKKDLVLDGSNPTILYGYGGFNVSLTPRF